MKSLFIDCSKKNLSLALISNENVIYKSTINSYSKHSNHLMNEIVKLFDITNNKVSNIDNIIVINGPGSFTGVRIGVTVAKTLSWSLNKKLYQVNALDALKAGIDNDIVICVIPDKPTDSYVGLYKDNISVLEYLPLSSNLFEVSNKNITIISMEVNDYVNALKEKLIVNNSVNVNIIKDYNYLSVTNYALSVGDINPHLAEPIYLKKIDVEKRINDN